MRKERSQLMRTFADPVLIYASVAIMSIMYNYRSSTAPLYGIAAYISGWIMFRLFDYINKHHFIGTFIYIIIAIAFIQGARTAIDVGRADYPLPWGVWFLTPQNAMTYNPWYAFSIFLLFQLFLMSVIYYFTYVRYRMFMNFLILMIPFTIYDKEADDMNIGFIIPLVVGFILLLMNFRQLRDTEKVEVIDKPKAWLSAGVFTVLFAVAATVIPKPAIQADRTIIDNLMNADALTDRFMAMLSVFRNDSGGEQFRGQTSDITLYYVVSPEPMRLKTAAFTTYDFSSDSWRSGETDSHYSVKEDVPFALYNSGELPEAIRLAASVDEDFAKKYGLEEFAEKELYYPQRKSIQIYSAVGGNDSMPVPQGAEKLSMTSYKEPLGLSGSGTVFTDEGKFAPSENYTFLYSPDTFFFNEGNRAAVEFLSGIGDFSELLEDAEDSLRFYKQWHSKKGREEIDYACDFLAYYNKYYGGDMSPLLDYGGSSRIKELADEITEGLDSDYDKARALERYFINNDYVYDLKYQKANGDNVEDFLFDSKTGVCYEYATAMTLLARAAGIPARYCEGYNMQRRSDISRSDRYIISTLDAHGFPELYIKGYGWISFEPTVTFGTEQHDKGNVAATLTKIGIIVLIISAAALIFIFFLPSLKHRIFIIMSRRWDGNKTAVRVMKRLCRIYGIPSAATAHEAVTQIKERSGADITAAALIFEAAVYGGEAINDTQKQKAIDDYYSAYAALKKSKKKRKRKDTGL